MVIGSNANKTTVDVDYYVAMLQRQRRFLERSCRAFDQGDHDEAIRMAVTLRVLLHDTSNSTSLMSHLGIKENTKYVDSGSYREEVDAAVLATIPDDMPYIQLQRSPFQVGLVESGFGSDRQVGWFAPLRFGRYGANQQPRFNDFEFWWTTPLVEGTSGKTFSRWDLIKIMANQDGGAHVDQVGLDADYQDLAIDNLNYAGEVGVVPSSPFDTKPLPPAVNNVTFASVRQIAFELEWSLIIARHWPARGAFALAEPTGSVPLPLLTHTPLPLFAPFAVQVTPVEVQDVATDVRLNA